MEPRVTRAFSKAGSEGWGGDGGGVTGPPVGVKVLGEVPFPPSRPKLALLGKASLTVRRPTPSLAEESLRRGSGKALT